MSRKSVSKIDFYFEDFLTGTDRLSSEALGVYIRLLCILWSRKCVLEDSPDQDVWLARRCNISTRKFRSLKQELFNDVDGKFTIKDGCYFNDRAFSAYKSSLEIKRKASEKGMKGAEKRWEKEHKTAENSQSHDGTGIVPANAQAMATTTSTTTHKKKKNIKESFSLKGNLPEGWTEFRQKYPSKAKANWAKGLECFVKWIGKGVTIEEILFAIDFWDWSDEEMYRPHPEALLNKELWKNMGDSDPINDKWTTRLIGFMNNNLWHESFGPYPTTDEKPDGPLNPECGAGIEKLREIFKRGPLI